MCTGPDRGLIVHMHTAEFMDRVAVPLLLTPEEAARMLGCGRTYVYGLIASGELESVKVGRLRRVPLAAVQAYVEQVRAEHRAA